MGLLSFMHDKTTQEAIPPQFGQHIEGREYIPRPSVYAVILDSAGRLCVVRENRKYHLPGGGIDHGESTIEALRREILEETGMTAEIGEEIGRANEYVETPKKKKSFNKLATFHRAVLSPGGETPMNFRDSVFWMPIPEFQKVAAHRMDAWIVGQLP